MGFLRGCWVLLALVFLIRPALALATPAQAIQVIRAVGPEGQGNEAASKAWSELAQGEGETMMLVLRGMQGAGPLSLNWLRAAVDTIAARLHAEGRLPMAELKEFLGQRDQHPRARRLAFELIARADRPAADGLLAGMLNDPSIELRREAVARLAAEAARPEVDQAAAVEKFERALEAARDVDQIEAIVKSLQERGREVRLSEVFGWITEWKVIGPFDSKDGAGFEKVFPPEEKIDFATPIQGRTGLVQWVPTQSSGDFGILDLNKPLGALKEVAGYALAEIQSRRDQTVELRLGCKNAWKIWCNSQFLFGRDEYHRGMEIDQYILKTNLKAGRNVILVKVCQNAQTEDWTKEWEFQLRITDEVGTPIKF